MEQSRTLGLIGGLGVAATVYYYERLAKRCEQQRVALDIVITHARTPRVFEFVEAGDRDGLAEYLNGYLLRMKAAGAEVAAIPAVTPHYCIDQLTARSTLPVISIFEPLQRELARRAARRVAIFGTRFVIESQLFGGLDGIEFITPRPDEVDLIHTIYVQVAASGVGLPEQHQKLSDLAQILVRRDGLDAIILAGTDLTLLFDEANTMFPSVDSAAVHVEWILKQLVPGDSAGLTLEPLR